MYQVPGMVISKTEFLAELYPIFHQIAIKFMVSAW